MHIEQGFEPFGGHVVERRVTNDPGVVNQDVDASPGAKGGVDDRVCAFRVGHAVAVGNGLTAPLTNLFRGGVCDIAVCALPRHRPTRVIDDDPRATGCQEQCVLLAQTSTGAGDHGNLVVESQLVGRCHRIALIECLVRLIDITS